MPKRIRFGIEATYTLPGFQANVAAASRQRRRTGMKIIACNITPLPKTFGDPLPRVEVTLENVGSSRVDLQACKLEYSIVSPK